MFGIGSFLGKVCSAVYEGVKTVVKGAVEVGKKVVGAAVEGAKTVVKGAVEVGKKIINSVKEKVAKACTWVAEKGEKFVEGVKKTWNKTKKYAKTASTILKIGAMIIPIPVFQAAALTIASGLDKMVFIMNKVEKAPWVKKFAEGAQYVIKAAKFIKERFLTPEEFTKAKEYQEVFEKASEQNLNTEQRQALQMAQLINNYGIVKVQLRDALEWGVTDFNHYLRLRATQKLLNEAEAKLNQAKDVKDVSADDIFLIKMGEQLLSADEPTMLDADIIKLNDIVIERMGKPLLPFVFEEMMLVWVQKQQSLEQEWQSTSKELSTIKVQKNRLEVQRKISGLTGEEETTYNELNAKLTGTQTKLSRLEKECRSMTSYVYAAEGFMQILEKDEQMLQEEGKDYLLDDSAEIAQIIMRVAENNADWDTLTEDEQFLITDYANIFQQEGKQRAQALAQDLEMEI